ncbi:chemotaxis protein CheW [Alicyclobacillus shizuokensis]|uniref:chemotaxis protein CheW n=1 Tax=Alicyclobacillus shizuokensis TaxID=392014 RepID=UPI0008325442|nr:chemotaxis protein CheW [Alicyclobacillus shizuokensis]MCL6625611.1 chemotaxis protein CheW [Alicyclobacillus shizuokensis]
MSDFQAVVFRLGEYQFAADARQVVSIERCEAVQPVPGTLPSIKGVVSRGDEILPVFDLAEQFGYASGRDGDQLAQSETKLVVVNTDGYKVALAVDDVIDIVQLDDGRMVAPPDLVGGVEARYLLGVVGGPEKPVVLMNLERVLSDVQVAQLKQVQERVRG